MEEFGNDTLPFHEREIWWCSIGVNLGQEEDGKNALFERPVLVLKKFNNRICWVLPMSTKQKDNIYYHRLAHDGIIVSVVLSQIRLVSVKRFRRFVRKISPYQFESIRRKLISFLESSEP